jgi:hypothetical protein
MQQVNTYYQEILGRSATGDAASNFWVNLLQADDDETEVIRGIMTSQEYQSQHSSDPAFVTDLYFRLFGRSADNAGLTYWEGQLANNVSRAAVIDGFLHSTEGADLLVGSYYSAFLQRSADAQQSVWITGVTTRSQAGSSGTPTFLSYDQLAVNFLASSEFFQNAQAKVP